MKTNAALKMASEDIMEIDPGVGSLFNGAMPAELPCVAHMDGPFLNGRFEIHNPRRGFYLYIMDVCPERDMEIAVRRERPMVVFSMILSGISQHRIQQLNHREFVLDFKPGNNIVGRFQAERSRFDIAGGQNHRMVDLHIDPAEVRDLIVSSDASVNDTLYSILSKGEGARMSLQKALPTCLGDIAHQVLNCRLKGLSRQLFMESKALEILALEVDLFSKAGSTLDKMSRADMGGLEMARQILHEEFIHPPSLIDLARRVGLNDFKLKRGFRQLYNTTVFSYVRRLRMEKAHSLLENEDFNVTEAAMAVGYNCIGHFSAAFKKHYGRFPSQVKRGAMHR